MAKKIKSEEFDRIFDDNSEDIVGYLDVSTARHPSRKTRKVNVDLPEWMIISLDAEADRLALRFRTVVGTT